MKIKVSTGAAGLFLAAGIATAAAAEPYPINHDPSTSTGGTHDRWVNSVSLAASDYEVRFALEHESDTSRVLYHNLMTAGCFAVAPGVSVKPSVDYSRDWMHAYLYIDINDDGQFDPSGELFSYSYLDGKNSAGDNMTNENTMMMPAFTIPEGTRTGVYRGRFKVDWDNSDPGGSATIAENGGAIVDVTILIAPANAKTEVSVSDGEDIRVTATVGSWPSLNCIPTEIVTPSDKHIGQITVTGIVDESLASHGNPTTWTATIDPSTFFLGNGVIPNGMVWPLATVTISAKAGDGAVALPYAAEGYRLIWNDEFNTANGTHPSTALYETPRRYNAAWNRFISTRPDLMVMNDGVLRMYCKPNPEADRTAEDDREMVSGAIQTAGHFSIRHGRVEARMRVEGFTGSFPAFWMMPVTQPDGWPTAGEIDIFESINDKWTAYGTIHTGRWAGDDLGTAGYIFNTDINQWHVYGIEWDENFIRFFVDGIERGNLTPENVKQGLWPFNEREFYIILNQSVGAGTWAANPDTSHTYLTEVDWVRVYQREGQEATGAMSYPADPWGGIELPTVDGSQGPEGMYNLQGVRVNPSTAVPGVYILRDGRKTEKVIIR